jgi:hypothetical protein
VLAQLDAVATGAPAIAPVLPLPQAPPPAPQAAWAPSPYAVPTAPVPWAPSATYGRRNDRIGVGRSPWDFGIPGWQR